MIYQRLSVAVAIYGTCDPAYLRKKKNLMQTVAFSGGKDSTSLSLRMAEIGESFELLFTPTGDELPDCLDHIAKIAAICHCPLIVRSTGLSLYSLIDHYNALPNNRQRWCTRQLKIEVAKSYLLENPGSILCVGLRADEEHRHGMWGDFVTYRYPLREWGWGLRQVNDYLKLRDVSVPERTDCSLCYDQRIVEWYKLFLNHRDRWERAKELEAKTGHTFRSPTRDTWPASLAEMQKEFERGRKVRGLIEMPLFDMQETYDALAGITGRCRVCSM